MVRFVCHTYHGIDRDAMPHFYPLPSHPAHHVYDTVHHRWIALPVVARPTSPASVMVDLHVGGTRPSS